MQTASLTNTVYQGGIENFVKTDYLDSFIKENILADNSDIMRAAADGLSQIFGPIDPTYESIVKCIIPFLSAFNFGALDFEALDLSGMFTLASPSAFAYLAGLSGSGLEAGYLTRVNAFLSDSGYTGTPVAPIISLSASASSNLLSYVSMEQNGYTLEEIAQAGFNWQQYLGNTSTLDIANALVKVALGDANKLGDITSLPGVGPALVNLLCDLLNDIQTKPVSTILAKLSKPENLTPIADLAFSLLSRADSNYKSYELFFTNKIFRDSEGNTTFYDAVVDGELIYTGPYSFAYYIPLVASAIDFLSGLDVQVEQNEGDLLKTLLFNKLPQLKNVILSAISYKDEAGNDKAGAIFYLLLGYADFEKAQNEVLCYELLRGLNEINISAKLSEIEYQNERLDFLHQKLDELKPAVDAKRFAKAKELGVLPADAVYSDGLIEQAIDTKIAELEQDIAVAQQAMVDAQADIERLEPLVEEKFAPFDEFDSWLVGFSETIYNDLSAIFESHDYSAMLDDLRANYADEYNEKVGEGAFEDFIADIISQHDYFKPDFYDIDDFVAEFEDNFLLYGGNAGDIDNALYEEYNAVNQEYEEAQATLTAAKSDVNTKTAEYTKLADGTILAQINAAGKEATIKVMNADLEIYLGEVDEDAINESIQNIEQQSIGAIQNEILEMQAENEEYLAASKVAAEKAAGFNFTLIPLASQAADAIAQGVVDLLAGKAADGSQNVYNYIKNRDIEGIITSEGRLQSLFEIIVGIYGPALNALVSQGMLSEETATQLIAATPSFDSFYSNELAAFPEAFKADPVPATAALINALCTTILTGFEGLEEKNADTKQIAQIDADIAEIFSKDSGTAWEDSYSKSVITRTGEVYQLIVDLLGLSFIRNLVNDDPTHTHSYTDVVKEPTCTKRGYTIHTCECGDILIDTYVPALGHVSVTDEAVAPTCTETGLTEGAHCSRCDAVLTAQKTVPALGHDPVTDAAVAPTCTETGLTEGSHCARCKIVLTKQETVPATGHSYSEVVTAPTCTEQGYTTYTCKCGDSYVGAYVPALGHDMTFHDGAQATCTETGNKPYNECSRCHNYYIDDMGENLIADKSEVIIPATGHNFETNEQYCLNGCGTINPNYQPPHVHDYKAVVTPAKANAVGFTQYKCDCGEFKKDEAGNVIKDSFKAPTGKPAGFKCAARTATAMKFTWTKTAGVSGYQIQLLNSAGKSAGIKALTANTYSFAKLAAGHAYKARVRFYIKAADGNNYFGAWTTINSPTLPAGTAIVKLTTAKKEFTAQWKKGAVTGYQLQYSTNKKFAGAKTVTIKKPTTIKYAVKNLATKRAYYVRIRTYKTMNKVNYYSAWSAVKATKTK